MNTISIIRATINSIFDLFLCENFKKFQFFLGFTLLSSLSAYLFSFIYYFSFFVLKNPDNSWFYFLNDMFTFYYIHTIASSFLIVNCIVLLIFFNSKNGFFKVRKIRIKDVFSSDFKSHLLLIFGLYAIITFFHILLSDNVIKADDKNALDTLLKADGFEVEGYYLNTWISNVFSFFKFLLPFLSLIVFNVYLNNNKKINWSVLREHKIKILSSLILILVIDKVLNGTLDGLNKIVFSFIHIPFKMYDVPIFLDLGIYVCLLSISFMGFFGAIFFPFYDRKMEFDENDNVELIESSDLLD